MTFTAATLVVLSTVVYASPVDFDTEIVPILTRRGCNSGSCHGAAAGRGGFKLSLFASKPAEDHTAIAMDLEGRRVNLAAAEKSLFLRKPLAEVDHEGGDVLAGRDEDVARIRRWIDEGARRSSLRQLTKIEVTPGKLTISRPDAPAQRIAVHAVYENGQRQDVTRLAVFAPSDSTAIVVDELGNVRALRRGAQSVVVRFLDRLEVVSVSVPMSEQQLTFPESARKNWIDDYVLERLEELSIPVSPPANDAELLRRLHLDLTGRLPSIEQRDAFLREKDPQKIERLADRLLASEEFLDYWTYTIGRWLRLNEYAVRGDEKGAEVYHAWLRSELAGGRGWDAIARQILLAVGDSHQVGPANFHRQAADARGEAEHVAGTLLGIELRCANCHNHPLDRWTQDDYHGLAAVFAKLERNQHVSRRASGEVFHPETGQSAVPRIPGERFIVDGEPAEVLAAWFISPENPYFARNFVNRVWQSLMGRGLVEPVDALRPTNPASHPELLDRLAGEFIRQGFQIRPLVRSIVASAAYQRSSHSTGENGNDDRYYSRAISKSLAPEVYLDAVDDVLRPGETSPGSRRYIQSIHATRERPDLNAIAGCPAGEPCVTGDALGTGLTVRLAMLNGETLNRRLETVAHEPEAPIERTIEHLYLRALSRPATNAEIEYWKKELIGDKDSLRTKVQDLYWAMFTCHEFTTNH